MGERAVPLDLLVVVQGVRCEHDRPAARVDGDQQLARGVATHLGQPDAVTRCGPAPDQLQRSPVVPLAQNPDLAGLRRRCDERMAGEGAGGERVLAPGHHHAGLRELADVADVVVVRVRGDDQADVLGTGVEEVERADGVDEHLAVAVRGSLRTEPRVDQHELGTAAQDPEEVVHGDRRVGLAVHLVVEEHAAAQRGPSSVAHGEQFPLAGHRRVAGPFRGDRVHRALPAVTDVGGRVGPDAKPRSDILSNT